MGSADPPLAVRCLYGGRHRQHRRRGTKKVYLLGGPLGGAPARLATVHRSVFVRAAVCHQVGQRATHRLNGRPAACPYMSRAILNACDRRESFSGERLPTKSVSRLLGMLTRPSQPIHLGCFNPSSGPTETSVSSP